MTLTTVIPSLRRSIPDPLDPDSWPERTHASVTDVVVAGVSLCRLAEVCGTPVVHTAAAAMPGTRGLPSPTEDRAVVVLTITDVAVQGESATIDLDGCVDGIGASWREMRLLGRASTEHVRSFGLARCGVRGAGADSVVLPGDLRAGDLVAVPCEAPLSLSELRR